jgi:hypothetical protein
MTQLRKAVLTECLLAVLSWGFESTSAEFIDERRRERKPSKWTTVASMFCRSGGRASSARLITPNLVVEQVTQCYQFLKDIITRALTTNSFSIRSFAKRDAGLGRACVKVSVPRLPAHVR